jgi:hypothetical protein
MRSLNSRKHTGPFPKPRTSSNCIALLLLLPLFWMLGTARQELYRYHSAQGPSMVRGCIEFDILRSNGLRNLVLCMTDSSSVSGGCSEVYTIYPSSNICPNVSSLATSLNINVALDSGVPLPRHGWPSRGSDILFNPTNGTSPYTLTVIPASGTTLNSTFRM